MAKKKTSSKLKSNTSTKAWNMLLDGKSCKEIGNILGYTTAAIKAYAKRKFKANSMKLWADEIKEVGICEIPGCKKTTDRQAHHLLDKDVWPHLSRDLTNGICLCSHHHRLNLDISPHTTLPAVQAFLQFIIWDRSGVFAWYEDHKHDEKYQPFDYEAAYHELSS
jgi:hypothetical protein